MALSRSFTAESISSVSRNSHAFDAQSSAVMHNSRIGTTSSASDAAVARAEPGSKQPVVEHRRSPSPARPLPPAIQKLVDCFQSQREEHLVAFLAQQNDMLAGQYQRELCYAHLLQNSSSQQVAQLEKFDAQWLGMLEQLRKRADAEEQTFDRAVNDHRGRWIRAAERAGDQCCKVAEEKIKTLHEVSDRILSQLEQESQCPAAARPCADSGVPTGNEGTGRREGSIERLCEGKSVAPNRQAKLSFKH
ncbi:hypothetical protein BKA62DRAFT_830953 [Auriculariales sp. MPI-PUGE-AT-0066]|nr:hypothetical protein BKA62DRAFT_830953 [Auriculariales sp. MPI-PUGE-AT-0066]